MPKGRDKEQGLGKRKCSNFETEEETRKRKSIDPISTLTVARLREILRSRGLKVVCNTTELQDRLWAEVQSMETTE